MARTSVGENNNNSNQNTPSVPASPRPMVGGSARSSIDTTPIHGQSFQDKQSMDKARQRAATKDNQIRKTAGLAMSKQTKNIKSPGMGSKNRRSDKNGEFASNAVAYYELSEAETILESNTIVEAARHMAAKRLDFVLVVDGMGRLVGIVTDKDLAFRVVAEDLDPRQTTVSQVMTKDPQCVQSSASMIEALTKMVQNHFRHLPVMEEERIIGVLDIAKCLYDALQKLELADAAANQIAEALETVGKEFSGVMGKNKSNKNGDDALSFADNIRDCLTSPKISSILDESTGTAQCTVVNVKGTVRDAVKHMKGRRETAALVTDEQGQVLMGIFTTKDVLLRVVAAGLDPVNTTIIRVMTPHPDSVTPDTSIVSALRQMHTCHYLHLPVLSSLSKRIVGIVDVLHLTYSMLEQLSSLKGKNQAPLWHQLWSLDDPDMAPSTGTGSVHGTASQYSERHSLNQHGNIAPYAPHTPSIVDDFTHLPSHIVFKIKHQGSDSAILVTADSVVQLPSLKELEAEALLRFGVPCGSLYLVDEEEDLIPVRDEGELAKFVNMMTGAGRERINMVLVDRHSQRASMAKVAVDDSLPISSSPVNSTWAAVGAGIAVAGAGLAFFFLRTTKSSQ